MEKAYVDYLTLLMQNGTAKMNIHIFCMGVIY